MAYISGMRHTTATQLRAQMARFLDRVVADHVPLHVSRGRKSGVVVVSEEDWAGLNETLHLLSSPCNAERLLRSVRDLDRGRGAEHDLAE